MLCDVLGRFDRPLEGRVGTPPGKVDVVLGATGGEPKDLAMPVGAIPMEITTAWEATRRLTGFSQ